MVTRRETTDSAIVLWCSDLFPQENVAHAMFTRLGGVSRGSFTSLNVSVGVGDDPANVLLNRLRLKHLLAFDWLVSARQVHGDGIIAVNGIVQDTDAGEGDALVSDQPGVALMIQQADCQAVLLHDPLRRVIAAVHVGWRGSASNILKKTVAYLITRYRCDVQHLRAVVSPSLGPCCAEFVNADKELPKTFWPYQARSLHFNFWQISRDQLHDAGLLRQHIDIVGQCTRCSPDFFSYRRSRSAGERTTGRQASVIALRREQALKA